MLKINPYATHLPLLAACVASSGGPVLELGCGLYSTPVLHALCLGRTLLSVESDPEWYALFKHFESDNHHIILSKELPELPGPWSVVLIDQRPAKARAPSIIRLREKTELFVIHDTEDQLYEYEPVLSTFKHRIEWQRYTPWTSVVSDTIGLDWLRSLL